MKNDLVFIRNDGRRVCGRNCRRTAPCGKGKEMKRSGKKEGDSTWKTDSRFYTQDTKTEPES